MDTPPAPQPSQLTVRVFTERDYEVLAAFLTASDPESPRARGDLRYHDQQRDPGPHGRLLLFEGERLIGTAAYEPPRNPQPGKLAVGLTLGQDAWQRGSEGELWSRLWEEVKAHRPAALLAQAREDRQEYRFLREHGFEELDRMWASVLDLTTFDPAPLEHYERRAANAGITLRTLAELPWQTEAFQRDWYALMVELLRDVPSASPFNPWPFETWRERVPGNPKLRPQSVFFAFHEGQMVGFTELSGGARPDTLSTGLTGVRRSHRRRGVAQALKLAAARHAQEHGLRFIRTINHTVNRPMLSINEAMGFVKEPALVNLELRLDEEGRS